MDGQKDILLPQKMDPCLEKNPGTEADAFNRRVAINTGPQIDHSALALGN